MPKHYRAEDMAELLAMREEDGLSYAELARRAGVSTETLRRWRRRLSAEDRAREQAFVAVEVVDDVDVEGKREADVRVRIGSAIVDVSAGVDRRLLELVVEVLADRC